MLTFDGMIDMMVMKRILLEDNNGTDLIISDEFTHSVTQALEKLHDLSDAVLLSIVRFCEWIRHDELEYAYFIISQFPGYNEILVNE